jgi:hypothetical protein
LSAQVIGHETVVQPCELLVGCPALWRHTKRILGQKRRRKAGGKSTE